MTLLFSSTIFASADSTDKWVPKAPMSTTRSSFQTAVVNGKIYVIGGSSRNANNQWYCLSSVEEYDPDTDKWAPKASMLQARQAFQVAVINNRIYAIGGLNSGDLSSVEEYDPEADKWIPKKSLNIPRRAFQAEVVNNKIYAIGGVGQDSIEEYDPVADTWTMKDSMSGVRSEFKTIQIDGVIYAIGGSTYGASGYPEFQRKIEAYDIQKDKWSDKALLPLDAYYAGVNVVNKKIYITGGGHYVSNTLTGITDAEVYDPSTNICSSIAPMKKSELTDSSVVVNGNIYVIQELGVAEEYDPQTNTWEMKACFPNPNGFYCTCTAVMRNTIYAIFGADKTTYAYSPSNLPTLTVTASPKKVKVGQQFTTDIAIHNETNICAEDIKLTYDKNLFEYEGATGQTGTKIYKEDASTPGTIRFITACQGKDTAATGDKGLITLKFKAKAKGVGKVDIVKGRIADNATLEEDVVDENCGEDTITVDGYQDVNRSGNFTLLDLGIDAYYDGMNASDTDTTKYDADVIPDGKIDDNDLAQITQEILANKDYAPNN